MYGDPLAKGAARNTQQALRSIEPKGILFMATSIFSILLDMPWHHILMSWTYAMQAWIHACTVNWWWLLPCACDSRRGRVSSTKHGEWRNRPDSGYWRGWLSFWRRLVKESIVCWSFCSACPCLWLALRALKSMAHMHLMSTGTDPSLFFIFGKIFGQGWWCVAYSCLRKRAIVQFSLLLPLSTCWLSVLPSHVSGGVEVYKWIA
jgi:hypothetical protein